MSSTITKSNKTYVVEHLDPELEEWSALEYASIAIESNDAGSTFLLTSVKQHVNLPWANANAALRTDERSVEEIFEEKKDQVCLLDPAAKQELSPEDASRFNVFLFGGILGE
jgi:ribosome biogenesis SPOUT family RNA methylase Rps3